MNVYSQDSPAFRYSEDQLSKFARTLVAGYMTGVNAALFCRNFSSESSMQQDSTMTIAKYNSQIFSSPNEFVAVLDTVSNYWADRCRIFQVSGFDMHPDRHYVAFDISGKPYRLQGFSESDLPLFIKEIVGKVNTSDRAEKLARFLFKVVCSTPLKSSAIIERSEVDRFQVTYQSIDALKVLEIETGPYQGYFLNDIDFSYRVVFYAHDRYLGGESITLHSILLAEDGAYDVSLIKVADIISETQR